MVVAKAWVKIDRSNRRGNSPLHSLLSSDLGSSDMARSSATQHMHVGSRGVLLNAASVSSELHETYCAKPPGPHRGSASGAGRCSTQYSVMADQSD
jgi:hypothetical protein